MDVSAVVGSPKLKKLKQSQAQETEAAPSDYPQECQARYAAFQIAEHALEENM